MSASLESVRGSMRISLSASQQHSQRTKTRARQRLLQHLLDSPVLFCAHHTTGKHEYFTMMA